MIPVPGLLAPYKTAISFVAVMAALLALAIGVHTFTSYEQKVGYTRAVAEYQAKQIIADRAADDKTAALQKQVDEAERHAQISEHNLQTLVAASTASADSLRDTLAHIRSGVPSATVDALRHSTDTLAALLTDCQSKYQSMAAAADGHANDVQTLIAAWPK